MITRLKLLRLVREVTSRMPRVRGLGRILALIARAFRRQDLPDVEVSVFGRNMLLSPNDAIGNCLIFTPQWYDFRERRLIRKILNRGDYVIDVGANIGTYSLIFADLVGSSGKVTAIEAEQKNARRLKHNLEINDIGWVEVRNFGVSDKEERLSLLLNDDGNAGAHSFYRQANASLLRTQEVQCLPLSSLIDGARKPRLMKLDIEGFEWRVLRKYFEDAPNPLWPTFIMLEDDSRHRESDAVPLLLSHGYRFVNRFDANVFMVR